ncbi:hypothetical protein SAMN05421837_112257 [Amycolatopsis pretoriensis]|uniref:Uncharacterized protein n=1 Tax=Amycolatopsis pretoriensis TaxID=218821 RepID=A0A1H5RGE1_9PSEU|nr:hypothetical protein [Amycolatopsis pretoriensis]SEF37144.1 hypothetical protein SAMN05421837_112257 [Amycolatopsis pretoriensis]
MARQIWVLLGWSSEHGMASTPVGVLGLDAPEVFVEWTPREHVAGRIWRERLAGAGPAEIAERIAGWADTPIAPAVRVEPLLDGALADVVRAQLDDVLGSAR